MAAVAKSKFRSQRRRKRPKRFMGWKDRGEDSPLHTPMPVTTASGKKLAIAAASPHDSTSPLQVHVHEPSTSAQVGSGEEANNDLELQGYRLIDCQALSSTLTQIAKCSQCGSSLTLTEELSCRRGLVSRLSIQCRNTGCGATVHVTDPYSSNAKCLNRSSVLGMRMIGRGRSGLETFCAMMAMLPPVTPASYSEHCSIVQEESEVVATASQNRASAYLHELHGIPQSSVLDVTVTCDGTWSKRGFTALYGVVVVASWDSGQVLDCEILTKYCPDCGAHERMDKQTNEYKEWWERHKDVCFVNYTGSSPAMEAAGALRIWQRSVEKLKLRYTTMISDGDSKTIKHLNDNKPYGDVVVEKNECVGHVQKRLGTQLRTLKKSGKRDGNGKPVRFGGRGRLTDKVIDQLQIFYGGAIRGHSNDLDGMERAIWAIFYHSVSTDDNPQHQYCPQGVDSWCKYLQAAAQSLQPPPHKPKICVDLADYVKPIFCRLSKHDLLEKCLLGATQNQNESFNSTIWNRCPKTEFSSPGTINTAVNLAVITFNDGMVGLHPVLRSIGGETSSLAIQFLRAQDATRVKRAQDKEEEVSKRRRKAHRTQKKSIEERLVETEGVFYSSGAF